MKRWLAAIPVVALLLFAVLALSQLLSPKMGDFERVSRVAPDRLFETPPRPATRVSWSTCSPAGARRVRPNILG